MPGVIQTGGGGGLLAKLLGMSSMFIPGAGGIAAGALGGALNGGAGGAVTGALGAGSATPNGSLISQMFGGGQAAANAAAGPQYQGNTNIWAASNPQMNQQMAAAQQSGYFQQQPQWNKPWSNR